MTRPPSSFASQGSQGCSHASSERDSPVACPPRPHEGNEGALFMQVKAVGATWNHGNHQPGDWNNSSSLPGIRSAFSTEAQWDDVISGPIRAFSGATGPGESGASAGSNAMGHNELVAAAQQCGTLGAPAAVQHYSLSRHHHQVVYIRNGAGDLSPQHELLQWKPNLVTSETDFSSGSRSSSVLTLAACHRVT